MKLFKKVTVNDKEYQLNSENLTCELNNSSRALFLVNSTQNLTGIIKFYAGWNGEYSLIFTGEIISSTTLDSKQQRLFVRDFSNKLYSNYNISLRYPSCMEIINNLAAQSGCEFIVQDKDWAKFELPFFASTGTGWSVLEQLKTELELNDCVFASLPDGKIYFGTQKENTLHFDVKSCTEITATGATIIYNPYLYCGQKIIIGSKEPRTIYSINSTQESTRIEWL